MGRAACVGDDVVDLDDPGIAGHHLRERFVARVCTARERAALAVAPDPRRLLWTLFAAKEAAYKAAVKLGRSPGFAHRRFEVAPDLDAVAHADLTFHLRVEHGEGHVHAVATWRGEAPISGVERLDDGSPGAGAAARACLVRAVAAAIGCEPAALEVVRDAQEGSWDGFGPPRLVRGGGALGADVSLSHDGRYVSFAAALG